MERNKSTISKAKSYKEMGEFWDTHSITDYWDKTKEVEFEVDIQSEARYCAIENTLAKKVSKIAWQKGVSVETILNLWVQEKVEELTSHPKAALK